MSDGGGRVQAALRPIQGAERIARFLFGIRKNVPADAEFRLENINGGKGLASPAAKSPAFILSVIRISSGT
jgi:RNA polymerase sigma-70 factor (ECF subfamily)